MNCPNQPRNSINTHGPAIVRIGGRWYCWDCSGVLLGRPARTARLLGIDAPTMPLDPSVAA